MLRKQRSSPLNFLSLISRFEVLPRLDAQLPHCHLADPGSFTQASTKINSATTRNEVGITKK